MESRGTSLEDNTCPVCLYVLIQPVTMPCKHELCLPCFKKNVKEANLTCPMCRMRISTWTRKASRTNTLVNEVRWSEVKRLFRDKVERRLQGIEEEEEVGAQAFPNVSIAKPGEIRKEYEEEIKKIRQQQEEERKMEEAASEALILKLQEEEMRKRKELESIEKTDEELAKELSQVMNEAGSDSPFDLLLRESRLRMTRSISTSSNKSSSGTIETFLSKMRDAERRSSEAKSPYPYKCMTPTDDGKICLDKDKLLQLEEKYQRDKVTHEDKLFPSSDFPDIEERYRSWRIDRSDSNATVMYDPKEILNQMSDELMSVADSKTNSRSSNREVKSTDCGGQSGNESRGSNMSNKVRSTSAQSHDSISQEISHFRPIQVCPKTPPRKLPGGKVVEAPLIRTTPRNWSQTGYGSPCETNLSDIDATSPIMKRRLSALAEERKFQVHRLSKSTSTESIDDADNENRYPGDDQLKGHNLAPKPSTGGNRVVDLKDISNSPMQNKISDGVEGINLNSRKETMAKKNFIIPLEPVLVDDCDPLTAGLPHCYTKTVGSKFVVSSETHNKDSKSRDFLSSDASHLNSSVEEDGLSRLRVKNLRKDFRPGRQRKHTAKVLSKECRKVKPSANVISSTCTSPQTTIKDWISRTRTIGPEGDTKDPSPDLFKNTISTTKRKEVYDDMVYTYSPKEKYQSKKGCSLKRGETLDRFFRTGHSDPTEDSPSKRPRKPLQYTDYVYEAVSPKKRTLKHDVKFESSDGEGSDSSNSDFVSQKKHSLRSKKKTPNKRRSMATKRNLSLALDLNSPQCNRKRRKVEKDVDNLDMMQGIQRKFPEKKARSMVTLETKSIENLFSGVAHVSVFNQPDTVSNDDLEEQDRIFALELQRQFELEEKFKLSAVRFKGSEDAYGLRNSCRERKVS
ncbi:hypothetical protein ACJMK2_019167 [Sinanodonta woodiana]|uniref:RING-type E3 ubiquitin transferase n=1 Tax=Sinanodonta woodiana TaxID=1069815 RepID=A0ABD3UFI2_SINWO